MADFYKRHAIDARLLHHTHYITNHKKSAFFRLICLFWLIFSKGAKIKGGGTFTKMLDNLKECGIIREYIRYIGQDYCWSGTTIDGKGAQIDLVIPAPGERTNYLCELKFSENKFTITENYAESLANKISAFRTSKHHKPSHSILVVMLTTMGLSNSKHNSIANISVCLNDLFE